jgi:hypothetical protein
VREIIRTSDNKWLEKALDCYKTKVAFEFIDDASIGIGHEALVSAVALIAAAKKSGTISWQQIAVILTGLGISGLGIWLITVAVADPEPTSKLSILLVGGVLLMTTGGLSILYSLGVKWRVSAKSGGHSIHVDPA